MNLPIGEETHASITDYYLDKIQGSPLPTGFEIVKATKTDINPHFIRVVGYTFVEYDWIWNPKIEVPDLIDFEHHYGKEDTCFWVIRVLFPPSFPHFSRTYR